MHLYDIFDIIIFSSCDLKRRSVALSFSIPFILTLSVNQNDRIFVSKSKSCILKLKYVIHDNGLDSQIKVFKCSKDNGDEVVQ